MVRWLAESLGEEVQQHEWETIDCWTNSLTAKGMRWTRKKRQARVFAKARGLAIKHVEAAKAINDKPTDRNYIEDGHDVQRHMQRAQHFSQRASQVQRIWKRLKSVVSSV